uniref:CHHC U11-48K-type domain-containing protein n=1 Tax=Oryza punctata TaxID=4537 RepID=A0A0E0KPA6_ORYPU
MRCGVPRWEAGLRRWVLAASPRYGIVIDAATRDHIWVLVRLCLKVAASEACCSLENACGAEGGGSGFVDPRAIRFECPRLVDGISWLGAQLRILYGEGSGRSFAIAAVREAILHAGSCLAIGVDSGGGSGVEGSDSGNVGTSSVSVAQVAAAIAALHERFCLEEKIKALRSPRPAKYQLLLEYSQALERGHEERSKRPNYRAVLEYDGIISRRVDSQESGRAKTREELLAEERDYKRRRTSYRGKKVKRNPKEILRDIIDEHMEEIKQAGGIGCLLDVPGDIAECVLKNSPHDGTCQRSFNPTSSSYARNHCMRDSYKDLRNGSHQRQYQKVSDHENRRIKDSESTLDQRYSHHHENSRHQRNSDDHRKYGYNYDENGSDYYAESSGCTRWSSEREYDRMSRVRSNDVSTTSHTRHRSVSVTQDKFSDRYDPQSTYSDVDPATSMIDEGSTGQRNSAGQ